MVWTGTVIIRREVLGNERFVAGLEPAEDRDLWVRLTARHACYLISEPLATAVLEEGSLSRTNVDRDCGNMLHWSAERRASRQGGCAILGGKSLCLLGGRPPGQWKCRGGCSRGTEPSRPTTALAASLVDRCQECGDCRPVAALTRGAVENVR